MPPAPRPDHAPVVFTDDAFDEDMAHATSRGRTVGEATRRRYERHGVPIREIRKAQTEGRDATILPNCLKVYLPAPDGPFGMVFKLEIRKTGRLRYLAFGVRHPTGPGALSVYEVAHQRIHGQAPH